MRITVHHAPAIKANRWHLHAWQEAWDGNLTADLNGISTGTTVDFVLPDVRDPRTLQFLYHSITPLTGQDTWEAQIFTRRPWQIKPTEVWTFEASPRLLYASPYPPGVAFAAGATLTAHVITLQAFRGGRIFVWNPYNDADKPILFPESARNDTTRISTFLIVLAPWMTNGFNLKLMQPAQGAQPDIWEPDSSNRVWRPVDGSTLWLKSGQCDVRSTPLSLTPTSLEVLYSAEIRTPPMAAVQDVAENATFIVNPTSVQAYANSPLFLVASYDVPIYAQASYLLSLTGSLEQPTIARPFPAEPTLADNVSRCALGASAWLTDFPSIAAKPLTLTPLPMSCWSSGVSVQLSIGNGPAYVTTPAVRQANGSWLATLPCALDTTTAIDVLPAAGQELQADPGIDTSRYVTPTAAVPMFYTTEGIYGVCSTGETRFRDPPDRIAVMNAAFGAAVVHNGLFLAREMPHGCTIDGNSVYFVVHAPHAVDARLIVVDGAGAAAVRRLIPMQLTTDTFYWWCCLPLQEAPPGKQYRFLLNDTVEVLDPASRAVMDRGSLKTTFGDDPTVPDTSWSVVLDVAKVAAAAHAQPWQTMGWEKFLIYEIHARRFTNLKAAASTPFEILSDELTSKSRLGTPGYLQQLPVTVLGLMPVNEFSSTYSWGYDPSYYFAIDKEYGGAIGLAQFVNAAHAAGRGVTLDVVYNHSLGSSLMSIAPDIYRNGDYDGDRMNCGHPMVNEFFRQVSVYLYQTFNLDCFRFDDTNTIITKCQGGWQFLGMIRAAIRAAANATGRSWPYCVAENNGTRPWDVSNPSSGVMDGQWGIDEVYAIRAASYDSRKDGQDDSSSLAAAMNGPQYWGRPFYQVTRFGESHDMVSGQDSGNQRIAARPPFGQGYLLAKALGALTLLTNGIPMLFMGQEVGETIAFSFSDNEEFINPQILDVAPGTDQTRILAWFRQIMGLRNDASQGLQGEANYQVVGMGYRTVAFTCGAQQRLFAVITFGTPDQRQNSGWLGLPGGSSYKEIFNSSWPAFQVVKELEQTNGGYAAQIQSGQILNLPFMGALVLQRT